MKIAFLLKEAWIVWVLAVESKCLFIKNILSNFNFSKIKSGINGLWFDSDLYHGRSQKCKTYDNDILTLQEDFIIAAIEIWTFTDWELNLEITILNIVDKKSNYIPPFNYFILQKLIHDKKWYK